MTPHSTLFRVGFTKKTSLRDSQKQTRNLKPLYFSEALGHDNEATTQIYLDSISTAKVDKANRTILDDL